MAARNASKFGWICLLCFSFISHALAAETLRGQRYCEVIYWHGLSGFVYNTFKLNDCPKTLWSKLTPSIVKNTTKAHFAYLNGPRYYVLDAMENDAFSASEIKTFGQIPMHPTAMIRIKLKDVLAGAAPYREHLVEHHLTWVYHAGKPVYELIDPKGHVFVMQSYTNEVVPQNEADLVALSQKLKLPKGWVFRTGLLKGDKTVVAKHHNAVVLLDNFKNIYQRAPKDLLEH